jgi:hypothetical protein
LARASLLAAEGRQREALAEVTRVYEAAVRVLGR